MKHLIYFDVRSSYWEKLIEFRKPLVTAAKETPSNIEGNIGPQYDPMNSKSPLFSPFGLNQAHTIAFDTPTLDPFDDLKKKQNLQASRH